MKNLIIYMLVLNSCLRCSGQSFSYYYDWGVSADCYSARQTTDGGYIMAGKTIGGGNPSGLLLKTDYNGSIVWNKIFSNGHTNFWSVEETSGGEYIIAGDALTLVSSSGNVLWAKTYDTNGFSTAVQTSDGGYIAGGYSMGNSIVKTNFLGDPIWTKYYPDLNYLQSVRQTNDGGYILCGNKYVASVGIEVALIKTDATGNRVWSKSYGQAGNDNGNMVKQTNDGGYVICGSTDAGGNGDMYLIKTNTAGDLEWSAAYGSASNDVCYSVQQTSDNGYILAGFSYGFGNGNQIYVVKTNQTGALLWSKGYTDGGASVDAATALETSDYGYMVSGMNNLSQSYFFLQKTDSNGSGGCEDTLATIVSASATIEAAYTDTVYELTPPVVANVVYTTLSGCNSLVACANPNTISRAQMEEQYSIMQTMDQIHIKRKENTDEWFVTIYDLTGKLIRSIRNTKEELAINCTSLERGIYILQIGDIKQVDVFKKIGVY